MRVMPLFKTCKEYLRARYDYAVLCSESHGIPVPWDALRLMMLGGIL